jgi:hypothetical protein
MAEKTIAAGFRYFRYGVVDENGYFIGSTTTTPVAGDQDGSSMLRLDGARTLPLNIPEADVVTVSGDDEPMVQFEFDPENLPSGTFEMAVRDNVFEALTQGTLVESVGDIEITAGDPKDRVSQTLCFLAARRAKSWKTGSVGVKKWENLFIPRATVRPLGAAIAQRTFNPYQYGLYTSRSDRSGWSTVNINTIGTTAAAFFIIDSDNPLGPLSRFTGDNTETVFNLPYAPVSGAKTYVYVNDVKQTVTTDYTVSGKVLTFEAGSKPASAAVVIVFAEIAESDLS